MPFGLDFFLFCSILANCQFSKWTSSTKPCPANKRASGVFLHVRKINFQIFFTSFRVGGPCSRFIAKLIEIQATNFILIVEILIFFRLDFIYILTALRSFAYYNFYKVYKSIFKAGRCSHSPSYCNLMLYFDYLLCS